MTATIAVLLRNGAGQVGEVLDVARRSEHLAACRCLPILSYGEHIARTVHENGVVILAGLTGFGKNAGPAIPPGG